VFFEVSTRQRISRSCCVPCRSCSTLVVAAAWVGEEGAAAIAPALAGQTRLTSLRLSASWCDEVIDIYQLTNEVVDAARRRTIVSNGMWAPAALAGALRGMHRLARLTIEDTRIDADAIAKVAPVLATLTCLSELRLHYVTDEGRVEGQAWPGAALMDAAAALPRLAYADVTCKGFGSDACAALEDCLLHLPCIREAQGRGRREWVGKSAHSATACTLESSIVHSMFP
jgi:hypothetical protein